MRGHHIYKRIWTPSIGEQLSLPAEENNCFDKHAVAVVKDGEVVGHIPRNISRISWYFLKGGGSITAEIVDRRRFGLGLEVPCIYTFTGPKKMIDKLKRLLIAIRL